MDIATKTVTTKVHTAVASSDDLKSVAISAVVRQLGLTDDAVVSSSAKVDADGSITVEVVEAVADASAPVEAAPEQPAEPQAPAVQPPVAQAPVVGPVI